MPSVLIMREFLGVRTAHLQQHSRYFWFWHLVLPLLLGVLLWKVYPATGLDDIVERWYYDPATHSFPLRDVVWMTAGMHTGLKLLVVTLGVIVFASWLTTFFDPRLRGERRRLAWVWVSMGLASLVITQLKRTSIHHCPWDIVDYGGYAPHLALFDSLPANVTPGRCFPGGHASAGFVLMALYFALRKDHPQWARLALASGLILGLIMGWSQTMRGAHFVSHTLWAAWVVWLLLLGAYVLFPPTHHQGRSQTLSNV